MELKSRDWTCWILLLCTGTVSAASQLSETNSVLNIDCTNDYEEYMSCDFDAQKCSEYKLTLLTNEREKHCLPKLCDSGRCCCSVKTLLILGESHNATVWKGDQRIESKYISVADSIKPKPPTIISVDQINKSFRVKWKTNTNKYLSMTSNVAYNRKGHTDKRNLSVTPTVIAGENIYEIPGRDLEASTTYVVSVRNYVHTSGKFSDSSNEWEFTTPVSSRSLHLAVIIGLTSATVIITAAAFCCFFKSKAKWWDTVAKSPNPNLFAMRPIEQKILTPLQIGLSSVSIESAVNSKPWSEVSPTDTSSGSPVKGSAGFPAVRYTDTKPAVYTQLTPATSVSVTSLLRESNKDSADTSENSPGSKDFDNMTYFTAVPSCPPSSEGQTQAGIMACDSACHPCEADAVMSRPDRLVPACPVLSSSLGPTEMSHEQCSADATLNSEESSLASVSSGTNTSVSFDPVSRAEAGCGPAELGGETAEVVICDNNPCYVRVPAGSHRFPEVDDDYQPFQKLVEQPEVLFSEERSGEKEEHLGK